VCALLGMGTEGASGGVFIGEEHVRWCLGAEWR
jgi:hypothetical protein